MRIIAFAGRSGSGKDEAVRGAVARLAAAQRFAFADPLKQLAGELWGLTDAQLWGADRDLVDPRYGVPARWFFQRLGQAVRAIDPSAWARALVDRTIPLDPALRVALISDLRFPEEARAVREAGGIVILIERPAVQPWLPARGWVGYLWSRWVLRQDVSEASVELIEPDAVIDNDGTVEDLHAAVLTVLARHGIQPPQAAIRVG